MVGKKQRSRVELFKERTTENAISYLLTSSRLLTHVNHEAYVPHLWSVYKSRQKTYKKGPRSLLSAVKHLSIWKMSPLVSTKLFGLLLALTAVAAATSVEERGFFRSQISQPWLPSHSSTFWSKSVWFRLQCYSTCQAASFASTTSCTFGGFFWWLNFSLKISSNMIVTNSTSKTLSQEHNIDLRPDLPSPLSQRLRPLPQNQPSSCSCWESPGEGILQVDFTSFQFKMLQLESIDTLFSS